MRLGGEKGRRIVLDTDIKRFDDKTHEYFQKIKPAVEGQSYEIMYKSFESLPGDKTLSDDVLKERLKAMYENYGKDDITSPIAILNSKLPVDYLINELVKIRS
jgi:hypothetical protein